MNHIIELDLTGIAYGGAAIGRHEGRIVFVSYGIPGERVRARITEERERFARAEVVEVLTASPHRVQPVCAHFGPGLCGGCHWQHIAYEAQLAFKQEIVADQLTRIGKFQAPPISSIVPSPSPWHYRTSATFTTIPGAIPVLEVPDEEDSGAEGQPEDGAADEIITLGFYSDDNSQIIPIDECHILHPALQELYDLLSLGEPVIERVRFQVGSDPEDRMIILHTADDLGPQIEVDFPVSVNLLLSDNEPVNLIGSPQTHYTLLGRSFRVTAGGFFQVNLPVAGLLVEHVLRQLDLHGDETVLDLYSGVGLFTAFIAERAGLVISAESYPPAVTDADVNLGDLDNVDLIEGPVEGVLEDIEGPVDAVVVDPPRSGLAPVVIEHLLRLRPARLIYVSCDPATLARDLQQLCRRDYHLIDVRPFDMFPQTFHIECVATLVRK
ncbi:MAG: class I SAM-dependent RNA methyltransferase [Anaerolineae bacterium]